jgi:hypothetical protein
MNNVRARNASAWLVPKDGTRTNHRLIDEMRRYDLEEEWTLSLSGAGPAGAS